MNWTVYILETLGLLALFTLAVIPGLTRDPVSFVSSFPPDIRKEYYRSQGLEEPKSGLTKGEALRKGIFSLAALFLLGWLADLAGARGYWQLLITVFSYMAVIAAFDTFFIDWFLFPRIRRWRLPGTEHMDRAYAQKWFHLKEVLQVSPLFLLAAVISAALGLWLF